MKYHYLSYILNSLEKEWDKIKDKDEIPDPIFESIIKKWLKARPSDGIEEVLDYYVRDSIKAFPYPEIPLFMQLVRNMMGDVSEISSLSTLNGSINGQRAFQDDVVCSTCGTESKNTKSCSKCKTSRYCNKVCQKLHWSNHKKFCEKLAAQKEATKEEEKEKE